MKDKSEENKEKKTKRRKQSKIMAHPEDEFRGEFQQICAALEPIQVIPLPAIGPFIADVTLANGELVSICWVGDGTWHVLLPPRDVPLGYPNLGFPNGGGCRATTAADAPDVINYLQNMVVEHGNLLAAEEALAVEDPNALG